MSCFDDCVYPAGRHDQVRQSELLFKDIRFEPKPKASGMRCSVKTSPSFRFTSMLRTADVVLLSVKQPRNTLSTLSKNIARHDSRGSPGVRIVGKVVRVVANVSLRRVYERVRAVVGIAARSRYLRVQRIASSDSFKPS